MPAGSSDEWITKVRVCPGISDKMRLPQRAYYCNVVMMLKNGLHDQKGGTAWR